MIGEYFEILRKFLISKFFSTGKTNIRLLIIIIFNKWNNIKLNTYSTISN